MFTSERDHLGNLLGRERRLRPRSIAVTKDVDDEVLQVRIGDGFQLRRVQQVRRFGKTFAPSTDALSVDPELHTLFGRDVAVGGRDDDLGAFNDAMLGGRRPDEVFKHRALARQQDNRG